MTMYHPDLSPDPNQIVKVTLSDLLPIRLAHLQVMIGGIPTTIILARVILRHDLYIDRDSVGRDLVQGGFVHLRGGLRVRRVIGGRERKPFILTRAPQTYASCLEIRSYDR